MIPNLNALECIYLVKETLSVIGIFTADAKRTV